MENVTKTTKTTKAAPKKGVASKATDISVTIKDIKGSDAGVIVLPGSLFKVLISDELLSQYIRVYLANQKQGTINTKTRGEVTASTKKIYRQKGTGRARHGALTASLFRGGGVTHGPKPRDLSLKLNKKQIAKALFASLSSKLNEKKLFVLDGISQVNKTKELKGALKACDIDEKKTLIVYAPDQAIHLRKAASNLKTVSASQDRLLNAYKVMNSNSVLFTKEGLADFISFRTELK